MKNCLSPEILQLLSERRFRGEGLFEILKHLEACEKCRSAIRPPTREEIFKIFEDDEPNLVNRPFLGYCFKETDLP